MEESQRVLKNTEYTIEVWEMNWFSNTLSYIADLSDIMVNGINMTWKLNDVEEVSFDIDLVQFENKAKDMGVTPAQILTPYKHDIRIRRNGEYIVGAQVVETNITINNDAKPTLAVRCTGFLNIFKDRYCPLPLSGYSYSQIAAKLVEWSQYNPWFNKNPTMEYPNDNEQGQDDVGINHWQAKNGTLSIVNQNASGVNPSIGDRGVTIGGYPDSDYTTHQGNNKVLKILPRNSQAGAATRIYSSGGKQIGITHGYVACSQACTVSIYISQKVNYPLGGTSYQAGYARKVHEVALPANTWKSLRTPGVYSQPPWSDDYYLIINAPTTGTLILDDVFCNTGRSFTAEAGVTVTSSSVSGQSTDRTYYEELVSTKDALLDLCSREEDNFEFWFNPDRSFHMARYKENRGSSGLWLEYPGNIHSMTINRSASELYNDILNIGSGIGDERLQADAVDSISMLNYGLRQRVETNNSITVRNVLQSQAEGEVVELSKPTDLPSVVIRDGSVNPGNLKVGQTVQLKVFNDNYLSTVDGTYRVVEMSCQVSLENVEQMNLTLEKQ